MSISASRRSITTSSSRRSRSRALGAAQLALPLKVTYQGCADGRPVLSADHQGDHGEPAVRQRDVGAGRRRRRRAALAARQHRRRRQRQQRAMRRPLARRRTAASSPSRTGSPPSSAPATSSSCWAPSSGRPGAGLHALRAADGADPLRHHRRPGREVTTGRGFALSLTYVLGMALTYTVAGAACARPAGKQVQAVFQQPWIIVLFAALFVALALSMFGLYTLQMPSAIQTRPDRRQQPAGSRHLRRRAVMGALSALDRHRLRGTRAGRRACRSSARAARSRAALPRCSP